MQVIYKFTHDGSKLLQTIGTPEQEGADATHFNRPTYMDWLPDGTFFVSDGYTGTRVAKFDKNGKFLMQWGTKGGPRPGGDQTPDTRPGYFSNVHGVAVNPKTREVFVNDRNNHRIQVFDENGKFKRMWSINANPSSLHLLYIGSGNTIWTFDRSTNKMLEYDLAWASALLLGQHGDVPRRPVGRSRHKRGLGGQFLRRRSRLRAHPEVHTEGGSKSCVPGGQAGQTGLHPPELTRC